MKNLLFPLGMIQRSPLPTCPTDCASTLPIVEFDECNPEINGAQIAKIYFTNIGNPLADWTSAPEWNGRLDDSGVAGDAIRTMHVIGAKPVPESDEKDISLGRKVVGKKTHTVVGSVDETNDVNHEMVRQNECGGNYLMWYETIEGKLYGGTEGIEASLLMDLEIVEDENEITRFPFKWEWKSKFTEERIDTPI